MYCTMHYSNHVLTTVTWGCIGRGQSERLQMVQNRATRIITYSNFIAASSSISGLILTQGHVKTKVR